MQHTNLHKNGLFCPFSLDKYHRAHLPSNKSSTEIDSLHTNNPIFNARNRLKKLRGKVNWFRALFFSTPSALKSKQEIVQKISRPKLDKLDGVFLPKCSSQYKSRILLHSILTVHSSAAAAPSPPPHQNLRCGKWNWKKKNSSILFVVDKANRDIIRVSEWQHNVTLNRLWFSLAK